MALGYSPQVLKRLWRLIEAITDGVPRKKLPQYLGITARTLNDDISRIKSVGIPLKIKRKTNTYEMKWPNEMVPFRFTQKEFFYVFYAMSILSTDDDSLLTLKSKLLLGLSEEASPIYDCGPSYGIQQNITSSLTKVLKTLQEVISIKKKIVFFYEKPNGENELRSVQPYKLIHSPISWYLVGYCEDRNDFRTFKLSRITHLKKLKNKFAPTTFDLKKYLGDAWWVQHDPSRLKKPYKVQILFKGEAAKSIKEYKFHATQKFKDQKNGTLVTWQLSYLNEFATWLMQWLGQIEIKSPKELKQNIKKRINN